jgi:hypothetical protein
MRTRGSLGWVFLAVVLAVPALMYYKSYTTKDREAKLAAKAKLRVPEGGIFPEPSDSQKFKNPITSVPGAAPEVPATDATVSTATAEQTAAAVIDASAPQVPSQAPEQPAPTTLPPAQESPSSQAPQTQPAPAGEPLPGATPLTPFAPAVPLPSETMPGLMDPETPAAPAAAAVPGAEVAGSTSDLVALDWRDPLLSPYDQFLVEQEELEKLIKRKEVEEQARQAKAQRERPVEQTLSLQGIVAMPEGNKAIINNDMYSEGEWIGSTGVKVLKISQNGVTFSHKGRTFMKRMQ